MNHKFALVIAFSLLSISLSAQNERLYDASSGLPGTGVNQIFLDGDGYVWAASQEGVSKFEGGTPVTYWLDSVQNLFEDSKGTLWACTSVGLFRYDRSSDSFNLFDLCDSEVSGSALYFTSMVETSQGYLVASTSSRGVYVIDTDGYCLDSALSESINVELKAPYISSSMYDSRGRIWLSYDEGGVEVFDFSTGSPVREEMFGGAISDSYVVSSFAEDPSGSAVLVATYNAGLLKCSPETAEITTVGGTGSLCIRTLRHYPLSKSDRKHLFIIGTETQGIHLLDVESGVLCDSELVADRRLYGSGSVHSILIDMQGNLWIGAYQLGVIVIPYRTFDFELLQFQKSDDGRFGSSCAKCVYKDEGRSELWVGTDGDGIYVRSSDGTVRNISSRNSVLSSDAIMSIISDSRGTLWIGTYLGGLYYCRKGEHIRRFSDNDKLPSPRIKTIMFSEADSKIYVGSSGGGLYVVSPETFSLDTVLCDNEYKWVSALESGSDGRVWIGTYNGLMSLDRETLEISQVPFDDADRNHRIYSLEDDGRGTLWCGTRDGVFRLDKGEKPEFVSLGSEGHGDVKSILCYGSDVWLSLSSRLCRIDPETNLSRFYYRGDGIQNSEFYTGASCIGDGILYFGGDRGIICFNPDAVGDSRRGIGDISFSKLTVMDVTSSLWGVEEIDIPDKSNIFSVFFSVPEYTNPDRVEYSYRLEGFDDDWHSTGRHVRNVTYTNIPHGKYVLKVRAFFSGGPDVFSENSIVVHVAKPWYLEWWALLLDLLLLLSAVSLVLFSRRSAMAEKKEKEAAARKEMRLAMFTDMTHEMRTPLSLVMNPLKKLREKEQNPQLKDTYNLMYRNCLRANRIINQLLDLRKVDDGQMKLHFVRTDIGEFIEDIMNSFRELATSNNILFTLSKQKQPIYLWIDPGNFDKIIFNLFSNAFKNTDGDGRIDVLVREEQNSRVSISIFNSGSHIDEKYIDRIFERFFQIDTDIPVNGSGVGLNLAKKLVELHHGEISASNVEGGVVFTINLPSGCEHLSEEELSPTNHHKDLYRTESVEAESASLGRNLPAGNPNPLKSRKSVVVVEDDAEALSYLCAELSNRYSVRGFLNGEEAWADICRSVPDVIVTDLVMPGMTGLALCQKVRRNTNTDHVPVIVLTSQSDEETQKRCSEAGADRFFVKPAPLDVFESVIDQSIESRNILKGKYTNVAEYDFDKVKMPFDGSYFYERIVGYIKNHLDDSEYSVEELSREIGISRVHLNRKLKEMGSVPPSMLIRSIRLKQAAYLLVYSKVNVSEIAYRVGFASHSYFTRAFREYFGMSPTEFTETYGDNPESEEFKRLIQ